jgi:hypothetical protein
MESVVYDLHYTRSTACCIADEGNLQADHSEAESEEAWYSAARNPSK